MNQNLGNKYTYCEECEFHFDKTGCTMAYAVMLKPEETISDDNGLVMGCVHGEKKQEA